MVKLAAHGGASVDQYPFQGDADSSVLTAMRG